MKKIDEKNLFYSWKKFILLNLTIAFVLTTIFCTSCFFSVEGLQEQLRNFTFSFFMSAALSFGGHRIEVYFENKISWIEEPVKRLILTLSLYLCYVFIISMILAFLFRIFFIEGATLQNTSLSLLASFTVMPIFIALFIIAIFVAQSWLMEWKKSAIEAEQLRNENLSGQYKFLKDQLNPHFLFNSLNVLSQLVYEDADKSAQFIQRLSRIYRYVLEVQEEELVPLKSELAFAESYLSLQKIRFDEALHYEINVTLPDEYFLPPLSLQLLLENAIKHNIVSIDKPLKISIVQNENQLIISNNIQAKIQSSDEKTGIGLENIKKRYQILSPNKVNVLQENELFVVTLPLLLIENTNDWKKNE